MENDAQEIVKAITSGTEHPAVFIKKNKTVVNARKISHVVEAHSQTVGERVNRLKTRVREIMAQHDDFVETYYGPMLAYQTRLIQEMEK